MVIPMDFLTIFLEMAQEEAEAILKNAANRIVEEEDEEIEDE